jgi:hypothetical protein
MRLNISIPDALFERLSTRRDEMNISALCAIAIERKLNELDHRDQLVLLAQTSRCPLPKTPEATQ